MLGEVLCRVCRRPVISYSMVTRTAGTQKTRLVSTSQIISLIKQWQISSVRFIQDIIGHSNDVSVLQISERYLFSASWDGTVKQWAVPELLNAPVITKPLVTPVRTSSASTTWSVSVSSTSTTGLATSLLRPSNGGVNGNPSVIATVTPLEGANPAENKSSPVGIVN
jgi:hypothetical protein